MPFDIETETHLDDLDWPVTRGECATLIGMGLLVLIAIGMLAGWLLVQIGSFVAMHLECRGQLPELKLTS